MIRRTKTGSCQLAAVDAEPPRRPIAGEGPREQSRWNPAERLLVLATDFTCSVIAIRCRSIKRADARFSPVACAKVFLSSAPRAMSGRHAGPAHADGGNGELIIENVTGRSVEVIELPPFRDAAIEFLAQDNIKLRAWATAAAEHVRKNFTFDPPAGAEPSPPIPQGRYTCAERMATHRPTGEDCTATLSRAQGSTSPAGPVHRLAHRRGADDAGCATVVVLDNLSSGGSD
jgi:hypothetical protein